MDGRMGVAGVQVSHSLGGEPRVARRKMYFVLCRVYWVLRIYGKMYGVRSTLPAKYCM